MKILLLVGVWFLCEPDLPQCPKIGSTQPVCCTEQYPCLSSEGNKQDFVRAAQSGSMGHAYALFRHYQLDRGNDEVAQHWLEIAAAGSFYTARFDLSLLRLKRSLRDARDLEKLEPDIKDLADQAKGNPFFEARLGWVLGEHPIYEERSLNLLQDAATHGSVAALDSILNLPSAKAPRSTLDLWCTVIDNVEVLGPASQFNSCVKTPKFLPEDLRREADVKSRDFSENLRIIEQRIRQCRESRAQ